MQFTKAQEIWKIQPIDWSSAHEGELSRRYLQILSRWVKHADSTFETWPERANCGHFFGGCHGYGTDTSFPAAIYAVLATIGDYDAEMYGISRQQMKERAIQAIRYLGFTHGTGPEECVRPASHNPFNSRKKWGHPDEDFFRATQTGRSISGLCLAARFVWDDLDEETKMMVQNIAASYADRWCEERPRTGTYNDTQEEENAWTANGLCAALNTFPDHPHHEQWKKGFVRWSANSIVTYKDCYLEETLLKPTTRGTEAVEIPPLRHVTIHADLTTENHGFVHPDYLKSGINLRAVQLIAAWVGGVDALSSTLYNNELIYNDLIVKCIQRDGQGIPVQGQDWYYAKQHESLFTHALLNVVHQNPDAARIEHELLDRMERLQLSHSTGCLVEENAEQYWLTIYQSLMHLEPLNAWSLLECYLLHLFGGNGMKPSDNDEMHRRFDGVHHYPVGNVIIHRSKGAFNAFNWRSNVMAVAMPETGIWSVTPMFTNYTGVVEFAESIGLKGLSNENRVRFVEKHNVIAQENGFGACVSITRGNREIQQNVAFVSIPDGRSFYFEQFRALKDCRIKRLSTGMIGVRNEYYKELLEVAKGYRTLFFPDGSSQTFNGFFGKEPDERKDFPAVSYLNLDQEIGYLVYGSNGMYYLNRHEFPKYVGIENQLVLNHRENIELAENETLQPLIVVTLPNQNVNQTKSQWLKTDQLTCDSLQATIIESDGYLIYWHLGDTSKIVTARKAIERSMLLPLYNGNIRINGTQFEWTSQLEAFRSGYIEADSYLEIQELELVSLDVAVLPDRLIFTNNSDHPARLKVTIGQDNFGHIFELSPNSFYIVKKIIKNS